MSGKETLDRLAEYAGGLLSHTLERAFGPEVHRTVVAGVSWADLGVLLCFLLLVVLVNGFAASVLRRKARQTDANVAQERWQSRVWDAVSSPFYLLIWIYGIYFAALPLLSKWATEEAEHPVAQVFDKLFDVGVFAIVFWLFFRLTRVLELGLQHWAAKSESKWDDLFVPLLGRTARVLIPVIAVILALPVIGLPPAYGVVVSKGSSLLVIGAVSWVLFQAVAVVEKVVLGQYDITTADNLQARKIHTQVRVISKTIYVIIGVFSVASALMLFEEVRRFGTSILASAGVIGIIVGFAAQKTIANLFAGFQLALTQPIRIDDVVIVENEWGRVEEITLTYVVIKIWDDRRLVTPLSYFIEKPFQNWTRVSASLLGSVFVWADYTMPVAELRRRVQAIVESCEDWDRRFWNFQVTDVTERAMQIRVLATAADSGKAWNLRCEIREKLIEAMQQHFQQSLPKLRGEWQQHPAGTIRDGRAELPIDAASR